MGSCHEVDIILKDYNIKSEFLECALMVFSKFLNSLLLGYLIWALEKIDQ